jgi:valyl-tRNA synthetase
MLRRPLTTCRYQEKITNQLTRLGASLDWSRVAFTMNDVRNARVCTRPRSSLLSQRLSKAVIETFCRMHEQGMLYRANRLVNWCVYLNTSLSNLEVSGSEVLVRVG